MSIQTSDNTNIVIGYVSLRTHHISFQDLVETYEGTDNTVLHM